MPLVITHTPDALSSVHDDIIFTVAENDKTLDPVNFPNYKFIADVYVGSELVARLKKVQDPATRIGIFNLSPILRNYLDARFNPHSGLVAQELGEGEFKLTVTIKFGEEYGFVEHLDVVADIPRVYFNHYHARKRGVNTELPFYLNEVASDRLDFKSTLGSDRLFIPYFPSSTASVNVTVTPVGGGIPYAGSFSPSEAYRLQILNVSPGQFNSLQAGTITDKTVSYTLQIGSQTFKVKLVCEPKYNLITLHFLNKWGGFDTMQFPKVSKGSIEIEKKDYGRLPYIVAEGGHWGNRTSNEVYYESRAVYSSQFREKWILNSDLLTDYEYRWLSHLVVSPLVYYDDNGFYYPVIINKNNYSFNQVVVDDLTNLTIEIEFGTTYNAQYR